MRPLVLLAVGLAALVVVLGAWTSGWEDSLDRQAELAPLLEAERAANAAQGAAAQETGPLAGETGAAPTASGPVEGAVAPEPPPPVDTVVEQPEVFAFEGGELETAVEGVFVDAEAGAVAVVVEVRNPDPARPIVDATIQIELLDASGTVVGTNTDPGTDERLNRIPSIPAGGDTLVVNDTIVPTGEVVSARAKATGTPVDAPLQELDVSGAALAEGPFGVTATGTVGNAGAEPIEQARVFAFVRDPDGAIVGAGSALLDPIDAGGEQPFTIFVVGQSTGELDVVAPAMPLAGPAGETTSGETAPGATAPGATDAGETDTTGTGATP